MQTSNDNAIAYAKGLNIEIEVELSTTYTDEYIENTPNIALDQNGCNFLREEWEKGLNLFDLNSAKIITNASKISNGISFTGEGGTGLRITTLKQFCPKLEVGKTYTLTFIGTNLEFNEIYLYGSNFDWLIGTSHTITQADLDNDISVYGTNGETATMVEIQFTETTYPLPYQEYNGAIVREKDIEPVLLWENSSPNSEFAGTTLSNLPDMSKYKYIVVGYKFERSSNSGTQYIKFKYEIAKKYIGMVDENSNNYFRNFDIVSSTSITISNGTYNNATANGVIVPTAIYGTNVL